ncbi:glycoside hydrolase family 27 protein, partial [Elizabethkingia anophelis]|nr:glycoside hydrolase family 27 protein [Elizabethkingia anophelis]
MKTGVLKLVYILILLTGITLFSQKAKPPIMGWSSWNNFRININEQMIKEQADALVSSGLYAA